MNPSPDPNSPLATLRQLREMLDAGTLTPAEFEALKRQLIFGADEPAETAAPPAPAEQDTLVPPAPAAAAAAESFVAPVAPPLNAGSGLAATTEPAESADVAAAVPVAEVVPEVDTFAPAAFAPLKPQDWMAALAPSLVPVIEADREAAPNTLPAPDQRNPLTLVFTIGGVLLLLAVFGYLLFGLPPKTDEHLSSTSQTPADTTRTRPETGPQAAQITLPPIAPPETVRVAPPVVRPVVPAAGGSTLRADSVSAPAPTRPAPGSPALTTDTTVAPTKP